MAFNKQELKQLKFLFQESEKRTEKKTREIVRSETRKIVHSETKLVICEALEELVLPRLQAVEDKQEEHSAILQDHSDSLERIENIQRVEVKRNDRQDEKIEEHDFIHNRPFLYLLLTFANNSI